MEKWQAWSKISFASGVDSDFTDEIASIPGSDQVLRCIQCGTCSAACPSGALVQNLFTNEQIVHEIVETAFRCKFKPYVTRFYQQLNALRQSTLDAHAGVNSIYTL
jgi:ferredoxin